MSHLRTLHAWRVPAGCTTPNLAGVTMKSTIGFAVPRLSLLTLSPGARFKAEPISPTEVAEELTRSTEWRGRPPTVVGQGTYEAVLAATGHKLRLLHMFIIQVFPGAIVLLVQEDRTGISFQKVTVV